jgi:hypothetical protein
VAPVPVDPAAAADREAVQAAGATAAADPVRVAALAVTGKNMAPGKVAQALVATQGHGTLSVVAIRDLSLTPTPVASG